MMSGRTSAFGDPTLGESEQDAHTALNELDKSLRSGKIGEQCEAIVRFPRLFEKFPFPILINASFLKLADIFRVGTNFLRTCVLRMCQQTEKHLDKISNVDEFVRRIYSVIHSNDPLARALTLRTLGAVACIIPERQQVHHSIRTSLDSRDNVEVEAAIYIATQFAAQSKTFSISMCNKIADMIQGQATPADMKLQLISILQHMHHDTGTAAMVRNLVLDLLPKYPTEEFVLVMLHTLTELAAATLVDIPNQVRLLLRYIHVDPRKNVKAKCLQHLFKLAQPGVHIWPHECIEDIQDIALAATSPILLSSALRVFEVLAESPKFCLDYHHAHSKLRQLCVKHSHSMHLNIVSQAIYILTKIICSCYKDNVKVSGTEDVISSLETLFLLLTSADTVFPKQLKVALRCAVKLSEVDIIYCKRFVLMLGSRLDCADDVRTIMICEALGAIASVQPESLLPLLPAIKKHLQTAHNLQEQSKVSVLLSTLLFQTLIVYNWNPDLEAAIKQISSSEDLWANYRIGRAAVRYGHHTIAVQIFGSLAERVSYEHWHFWLVCLKEMSEAEAMLSNTLVNNVERLDFAVMHYNKAIAALKAASTPAHNLQFQAEYMHIRSEFLQCLLLLLHTCNILCIVPPPAIASTIAQSTRDDLQRHGYITNQMRKCVREFKACGESYSKLYQTAFDADCSTLQNLQMLQQICTLLERCVESVCVSSASKEVFVFDAKHAKLEARHLILACDNAARICRRLADENLGLTITHKHVALLQSIVKVFTSSTLPIPRFFFQVLQSTSLKLAITPQPRVSGEFISVQSGSQLAVKVEGVIQHGSTPGLHRKVGGVLLTFTSNLQPSAKSKDTDLGKNAETSCVLTQIVTPHKDFFAAQCLLAFPRGGLYHLTIDASVVDEMQNTWNTGPRSMLTVKVPEDAKLQPISMPGMSGSANVILMTEDSLFLKKR